MSCRALLVAVATGATATFYPTYKSHTFTSPPSRASEALYSQVPLDRTRNQIRLLSLHPGRRPSTLQCTLRVTTLDDKPQFTALSYTWGEPIRRSTSLWSFRGIFQYLRGLWLSPFSIKYNLSSALQSLRHEEEEKVLWVDALCINQQDPVEKADQVARMKDIYSQAHTTCVWLGPAEDGSDTAMDFVRNSHKLDVDDPKLQLSDITPPWREMQALFARSWWGRIWIVQELFMSKNVAVRCGEKEVGMDQFRELVAKEQRLRVRARSGQLRGYDFPQWYFVPPANPFYTLLEAWARDQEVRRGPSGVQHLRKQALYFLPVHFLLFKQGLPLIHNFTSLWHMAWYGNLGLLSYFKFANRLEKHGPVASFSSNLNDIYLDGLVFDEIAISDPAPDFGLFSSEDRIWMERRLRSTFAGIRLKNLFHQWEVIVPSFPKPQPSTSIANRLAAFQQPEDAFWRTLIMDRFNSGDTIVKPPAAMGEAYRLLLHPAAAEIASNSRLANAHLAAKYFMHGRFLTTAISTIADRAFVMTKHGMMGLAPVHAKPGDVICILRGGQTPFVLRPKGANGDGERVWELVGDCYVHGIMDGSFALQAKSEDVRTFRIV